MKNLVTKLLNLVTKLLNLVTKLLNLVTKLLNLVTKLLNLVTLFRRWFPAWHGTAPTTAAVARARPKATGSSEQRAATARAASALPSHGYNGPRAIFTKGRGSVLRLDRKNGDIKRKYEQPKNFASN